MQTPCAAGHSDGVPDDVVLGRFAGADESLLRATFDDPDIAVWNPGRPDGDVAGWWQRRNDWSDGTHASWAIRAAADDRLLGSVSIFAIDRDQGNAEIGYFVLPAERGRSVAAAAARQAAEYAFGELGLYRLHLYHAVDNPASCRVAQRAGFRHEGTLRKSYRYGDGRRHDEHLHARLADE